MNELENKLGLTELTPIELVMAQPCALHLRQVPKVHQTYRMLTYVCQHDGMALQFASKKLITCELCEIAVSQNGLALEYVPDKLISLYGRSWHKKLCQMAVSSNGIALGSVPKEFVDAEMVEKAVLGKLDMTENEVCARSRFPIAFVPSEYLTKELMTKAVEKFPLCIKDIPSNRMTKALSVAAVKKNALALRFVPRKFVTEEMALTAIDQHAWAIRFVPEEFLTKEICDDCFKKDMSLMAYFPLKYITREMCLEVIAKDVFSVRKTFEEYLARKSGRLDVNYVYFEDFPESFRNDRKILNAIMAKERYGSLKLIWWNEEVERKKVEGSLWYNKRIEMMIPLHPKTLEYLKKKVIEPLEDPTDIKISAALDENTFTSLEESKLPIPKAVPTEHGLVVRGKSELTIHDLSKGDSAVNKIYYISDIHLEHQLSKVIDRIQDKPKEYQVAYITETIRKRVKEMVADVNESDMLLIGGDVAHSVELSSIFYHELYCQWHGGLIVSILGNHELWDGTGPKEWMNPDFKSRAVEDIVADYRTVLNRGRIVKTERDQALDELIERERYVKSILLENELYVQYKGKDPVVLSEEDIINATCDDLADLLAKCNFIVLGGIGFSGLNPMINAEQGLYRKAVVSLDEDQKRSERFRKVYEKVKACASEWRVVVMTHTPVYDWTTEDCVKNWIYVNGHTHKNVLRMSDDGVTVFSDNQVGYAPKKWHLNSFTIDRLWYDPFERYEDGIYEINSDQYMDFNRGRGIKSNGCAYDGKLYVLKRNKMYMFLLKSARSLCLMVGGQRKGLPDWGVQYYYDNMQRYAECVKKLIKPYQDVMLRISEEVKRFGGWGTVHGCIVDISFLTHIYVNPYDGKVSFYYAWDTMSRKPYQSVQKLLESEEPGLLEQFLAERQKNNLPLLGGDKADEIEEAEKAIIPEWVFGNEMYEPSRIMKAIQYVWEQNVIRIWNDEVLRTDALEDKKHMIEGT